MQLNNKDSEVLRACCVAGPLLLLGSCAHHARSPQGCNLEITVSRLQPPDRSFTRLQPRNCNLIHPINTNLGLLPNSLSPLEMAAISHDALQQVDKTKSHTNNHSVDQSMVSKPSLWNEHHHHSCPTLSNT
jgi:hypothetical protein